MEGLSDRKCSDRASKINDSPPLHLFSWFGFDEGKTCGICGSAFGPLRGVSSELQRSLNADGAELHWVVCVSRGWRKGNQIDVFRRFSCWILPRSTIVRHLHMLCKLLLLIGAESLQHLRHPQDNVRWDPIMANAAGPRCGAESYASPCRGPTRHFQSPFPTQPDMQPDMTLDSFGFSKKHIAWFCHWTCTEGHRALTPFECYHDATFSQDFLCLKTLAEVVKVGSPILKPCGGVASGRWQDTLATCVTCVTCVNVMSLPHCSPRLHKFLWGVSLPDIRRLCKNFARLRSCIVFKPQSLGYFEMWDLSREQGNSTPKRRLKTRW